MDVLLSVTVVGALAIPLAKLVATWGLRGPEIIGAGFTAYRPDDGWPHGVQERDDPWGWKVPPEDEGPTIIELDPATLNRLIDGAGPDRSTRR